MTKSELSFDISSKIGDSALHGPHQGAQKSTKTAFDESEMALSKFFSSKINRFSHNKGINNLNAKIRMLLLLPQKPESLEAEK